MAPRPDWCLNSIPHLSLPANKQTIKILTPRALVRDRIVDVSPFSDGVAPARRWRPRCPSLQTVARSLAGCSWWGEVLSLTPATGSPGLSLSISAAQASIYQTRPIRRRASSVRAASRWTHPRCPHASVRITLSLTSFNLQHKTMALSFFQSDCVIDSTITNER